MPVQPHKPVVPYKAKKGEEYMNPKQLDHFRQILNDIKAGLGEDIDRTVHTMQDEATIFADPNDRATQESDVSLELRNRDRERKLIKKIDEMVANRAGEYGLRQMRHRDRVKSPLARPTATLCIDCKT